jgi:sirohydrochlorin cobaltochelatase
MKPGILLAAFGASNRQAHQTLRLFDEKVRQRFADVPVRWAFTSGLIRDRLAARRMKTDSVTKALQKMCFEKYTHVAVQSLHIIPGAEYDDLEAEAVQMAGGRDCSLAPPADGGVFFTAQARFEKITVGRPLLHSDADVTRAARALLASLPPERTAHDAVVFMGHGTWHAGDSRYDDLSAAVRRMDAGVFIGTMDGSHTIDHVLPLLLQEGYGRVFLQPLLSVVGRHAVRDMAGDHPESWRSRIAAAGMVCLPVLQGMVEHAAFVDIWIDHLDEAMERLLGSRG